MNMGAANFIPHTLLFIFLFSNIVRTSETHQKRSPIGFQGVRGKRDATYAEKNVQPMKPKDDEPSNSNSLLKELNDGTRRYYYEHDDPGDMNGLQHFRQQNDMVSGSVLKRAPMGFVGIKGKKDFEFPDKRGSLGFQGVRGKKLLSLFPLKFTSNRIPIELTSPKGQGYYKRAPSGFLGMRGKKEDDDIMDRLRELYGMNDNRLDSYDDDDDFNMKLQQELDRLSESIGTNGLTNILQPPRIDEFDRQLYSENVDYPPIDYDKRAPSMGFFGMRGKKWMPDEWHSIESDSGSTQRLDGSIDKRVPSMGFHGMRGKKDVTNVLPNDGPHNWFPHKRIPANGFFGMRGKKGPLPSSFFGMRGKKGPYEFRGKFVGVRGKKNFGDGSFRPLAIALQPIEDDMEEGKRVPSGFQGLRGKKWSESAIDK